MAQTPRTSPLEAPSPDLGRWIGLVLIAVLLGEGIWGLIVSLTNNLVLPFMARTMGADVQSPLYLGKGDFNVPALFTSVLELCFAGIVAVILNSWVRRRPGRGKAVRVSAIPADPTVTVPSIPAVVAVQAVASTPPPPAAPAASSAQVWSPPEPSARPQTAAPPPPKAKPKPPKEIVYNSVGEPINPTEEE